MPRSFLSSPVTSGQQQSDNSAFLAGLNLGATAQGEYQKNLADQQAAEVDAQHKLELRNIQELAENYRTQAKNATELAKVGYAASSKSLDDQEAKLYDVANDTLGRFDKGQRDTAAAKLNEVQAQRGLLQKSFSAISPGQTQAPQFPQAPSAYDASAYSNLTPEYTAGVKGKLATDVATGEIKGMEAAGTKKMMARYGFPNVTQGVEYNTGTPLPLIEQGNAQTFKLETQNQPKPSKEDTQLESSAQGLLGQYLGYKKDDDYWAAYQQEHSVPIPKSGEAPDPKYTALRYHQAALKDINEKVIPGYQRNFYNQIQKNPALASMMQDVQSRTKQGVDWTHPSEAVNVASMIARRIGEAADKNDTNTVGQLRSAYNSLGLNAVGPPESFFGK